MRQHVPETGVKFVQANGLRHAYFEEGEGPLVLMFHGFPDTPHTWDLARPAVAAAGFRVVTPFLRGYAPSGIPDKDTDARTQGEDVLALIEALGHKTAIIVGHDWGASAVYAAAALGPDTIDKMVAVAIPHPMAIKPSLGLAWKARHFFTFKLPGAAKRFAANDYAQLDELVRRWGPTWDFGAEEMEPTKNALSAPGSCDAAIGYYRKLAPPPKWMKGKISVPTLAVAGDDDPALTPADYEAARRRFSGPYSVATIKGGHFCHVEDPTAFQTALLEFLTE